MPNGPTTYPTLGESIGVIARRLDGGFNRATVGDLLALAAVADELNIELAKTRAELDDTSKLASNRLAAMDDLRAELLNSSKLTRVANQRVANMTGQLSDLAAYAHAQPCACSEHELRSDPEAQSCDRCRALGITRNDIPL